LAVYTRAERYSEIANQSDRLPTRQEIEILRRNGVASFAHRYRFVNVHTIGLRVRRWVLENRCSTPAATNPGSQLLARHDVHESV